jgi:uncharacterized membrane protein
MPRTAKRGPSARVDSPMRHRLIAFSIAGAVALLAAIVAPAWIKGVSRAVAAYDAGAVTLLATLWSKMSGRPERTAARAALEDPGRNIALAAVLLSVLAGLASAISILGHAAGVPTQGARITSYALAIAAVIAGWLVIHTMFVFRYAHLYYYDDDDDNEADRGLRFPGTDDPSDYDFVYFSFVIGMTFQVSDVQVVDRRVRRLVIFHALISFAYSTMILALAINIVSGLLH